MLSHKGTYVRTLDFLVRDHGIVDGTLGLEFTIIKPAHGIFSHSLAALHTNCRENR